MFKNIVKAMPLISIDSATFDGMAYKLIGSFTQPCFLIRIVNNSNKDVTISYDGSTAQDFVPTMTQVTYNFETNSSPNNFVAMIPVGQKIWALGATGTGLVYVIGYYQPSSNG